MTLGRARRARARALVVPMLMSAPMWLVVGELALGWYDSVRHLGRYGPAALTLVVLLLLAAAADTGPGERWLARLVLRARAPRLHQRRTLAPVAQVLLRHGIPPQRLELLVGPGQQVDVTALGRRTVVVSRGLIDAVWSGQLRPQQAAAVIAHEVGVMRSGLTRHDPAMMVLLAPWKVWITWIVVMWGVVAAFLSHRVMVACLVIHAGVGIWLGVTEEPFMFVSTVVMAVVLATWWSIRSWDRARAQVGDQYLLQADLAGVYADLLTAIFTDDYTRDRAVRLRHPQLQPGPPVVGDGPPVASAVLSTTGR
ncbi:hypothetical protein [uncultured Serinicoccus sp.]|uniref:hypothetical protein n=1 Tax=uncultured Serinicoccus sp. TaxID=735514 RepID=UPI0026122E7C|nr:hypothetical protein [uncultured Serinicoccus sp.]